MPKHIVTHRGIDVHLENRADLAIGEGTWESFSKQLKSGFGIEFDIRPTYGGQGFAVCHDDNLGRLSGGVCDVNIGDIRREEVSSVRILGGRLCELDELLSCICENGNEVSALHLKHYCQVPGLLDLLVTYLHPYIKQLRDRLILFDVTPTVSAFLKEHIPELSIAASVSHDFDVERYGVATGNTLITLDEFFLHRELYSWVWLDEWDRVGPGGTQKRFICKKTIDSLCYDGVMVAAVSPELHATSSGLLGGEVHEDGVCTTRLKDRWREWSNLGIDLLCTDHASWFRDHKYKI